MSERNNNFTEITAGQTVTDFLSQINNNFEKAQPTINNAPHTIFVKTSSPNDVENQEDAENAVNGDIWIQYEQSI